MFYVYKIMNTGDVLWAQNFDRRCVCIQTAQYCGNLILTDSVGYDILPVHERCICVYFLCILFYIAYFTSFKETSLGASFLEQHRKQPSKVLYFNTLFTTCLLNVTFLHAYIIKFDSCTEINIHSWCSSVGMETSLKTENQRDVFPSPTGVRDFSFLRVSASNLGTTQTSFSGYRRYYSLGNEMWA